MCGHDLGVGTGDLDASVEAGLVVGVDDVALDNLASTDTAVVWPLGSGEAVCGPAIRPVVEVEKGVLLFETEPRNVIGVGLHELGALMSVVELVGGAIGVPALSEDEDVGGTAERIIEDSHGLQVDIRVLTRCLSCVAS